MRGALDGVRVVDLSTGPLGGMATMMLGDHGAEVLKVEPPGGDRFRCLPSAPLWLRGKKSLELDLHKASAKRVLHDLVASADVLVLAGPPARAIRWGVSFDDVVALGTDIVHCSAHRPRQAGGRWLRWCHAPGHSPAVPELAP